MATSRASASNKNAPSFGALVTPKSAREPQRRAAVPGQGGLSTVCSRTPHACNRCYVLSCSCPGHQKAKVPNGRER